jgi:perosamine synthetase
VNFIPVCEPRLAGNELEYVEDCIKTGWISSAGKYIDQFEEGFAAYCGRKYGMAVSNGTVALQLAVAALDLPQGSEVIMPSFTIISCAMAVVYNNLKPVFVDADPETWCMDVTKIEEKINKNTSAIMPVHIYGHPIDMDSVLSLAEKYKIRIIEDSAEAHGAEYKGKKCGSFGDISCFSFYANKIITTGEGGMVLTDDEILAERCRSLRNLSFKKERRFYHAELGFNFRITNLQAAIGLAQLENIEQAVEKKIWIGKLYTERLKDIPYLQLPVEKEWAKNVYWMYGIVLDESTGLDAVQFAQKLKEKGVETRPFFLGMHEQPVFQTSSLPSPGGRDTGRGFFTGESYPVAERIARQGLYLPSGLTLTENQMDYVSNLLRHQAVS